MRRQRAARVGLRFCCLFPTAQFEGRPATRARTAATTFKRLRGETNSVQRAPGGSQLSVFPARHPRCPACSDERPAAPCWRQERASCAGAHPEGRVCVRVPFSCYFSGAEGKAREGERAAPRSRMPRGAAMTRTGGHKGRPTSRPRGSISTTRHFDRAIIRQGPSGVKRDSLGASRGKKTAIVRRSSAGRRASTGVP